MIDRSGPVWVARMSDHKTAHHGKERLLFFGPKAQLILRRYLKDDPDCKLFPIRRDSYGQTVRNACKRLKISVWTPHWLRHNAATRLREQYGLEVAQVMLGHAKADMTQLYAQKNIVLAKKVAAKVG